MKQGTSLVLLGSYFFVEKLFPLNIFVFEQLGINSGTGTPPVTTSKETRIQGLAFIISDALKRKNRDLYNTITKI